MLIFLCYNEVIEIREVLLNNMATAVLQKEPDIMEFPDSISEGFSEELLDGFPDEYEENDDITIDGLIESSVIEEELNNEPDITADYGDVMSDSLTAYLREMSTYSVFTPEEEKAAFIRLENAKEAAAKLKKLRKIGMEGIDDEVIERMKKAASDYEYARADLINHNLRLVAKLALHYRAISMETLDLIQEGNLGLIKAVERYDYRKGYKFSTYALWWIRQTMNRSVDDKDRTVRIPVNKLNKVRRILRKKLNLEQTLGREVSIGELSERLGIPLEILSELLVMYSPTTSLDKPVKDCSEGEDETPLLNFVQDMSTSPEESFFSQVAIKSDVKEVLTRFLSEKEIDIINLRFGLDGNEPKTLEEVGILYKVTRERIRQIEAAALKKLRKNKIARELTAYLR